MTKRRRETDSHGMAAEMGEFKTVFVDTSLDTHLAMLVSTSDTVSDFKKKMTVEHKQCFPTMGEIHLHSVKVKRRSKFYHLPDVMLVWSAFHAVKGNWFLSADASIATNYQLIKNSCEFDASNGVKMSVAKVDDDCRSLSFDVNRIQIPPIPLTDDATEKNVVSEISAGFKFEKPMEKTTGFQSNICSEENSMGTDSRPRKKRKTRKTQDVCHNPSLEDSCALFQASGNATSITEIVGCGNLMGDAVRESPGGGIVREQNGEFLSDATAEVSAVKNNQIEAENRLVLEGISLPTTAEKSNLGSILTSQNLSASDERKEGNAFERNMDYELTQDALIYSKDVSVNVPDHSAMMDDGGVVREVNTDGSTRKRKKVRKADRQIQDTTDIVQTLMDETMKPFSKTHKTEKREEKGPSLEYDHEVIVQSNSKASDHVNPDLLSKETSFSRDADAVKEPEISSGTEKKKKKKKKKKTDNGISGSSRSLLLLSNDHIHEETGEEECFTHREGKDVQMLLDSSTVDATEKVQDDNKNEADLGVLTQAEQILEDVGTEKKNADKKTKSSVGNCDADIPAVEPENTVIEFNQVDKVNKITKNGDKKASEKRKKRKLTISEVQKKFPVEDQQIGIEPLTAKETSISYVNSEQEGRHVDSSQVLSSKNIEKLNEMHEIPENTDGLAKSSEKEVQGINFKQYFVPDKHQDKVDSGGKVKKATKSNQEAKLSNKARDNGLSSVSNSTELQNSVKPFENNKVGGKSRKKGGGRSKGDSAQNSDRDEMISTSMRRSSGASEKGVKDSTPSEIMAASSHLNKKNRSLDKSSSGRSEIFPGEQGNKRVQVGLNLTNMMPIKTPQKKSLFTKAGKLFQDNSGESSGDDNGSEGSTQSPSDSSSMSGDSDGESDFSQGSTRNGTSDVEERSTGRRKVSKLDLSASTDLTMDMILKSSKRFKKAKLIASQNEDGQNESQAIEFVPDSQPS